MVSISKSAETALHTPNTSGPSLVTTTCPYCGVGCGVEVTLDESRQLSVLQGSSDHPANFGRLCVKGSKLLETNSINGRLLSPMVHGEPSDWQTATQTVADKFKQVIAEHGPESVAFYVSGQLLTEDYYVANKLMKGYIGSANIDTNSRLCMSSAVAAYKRAFGADAVPCCYEDLEVTELLILVGSNAAWTHPVLFQRMERAKKLNPDMRVITIDPRKTATSELADSHLPIKPGTDVALFNGLIQYLSQNSGLDQKYIDSVTQGFDVVLDECKQWTLDLVAQTCDIDKALVENFYHLFCETEKVVTAYCMGVNQSTSGTDKANSIINCHLASGKVGKVGSGPFSLTGQPNAMGGREVGGLANMLACHMDIDNPEHRQTVQTYWQSPTIASKVGLKAVDMFDDIETGKVKAVWIMATNPMVSMPNREKIAKALKKCEMVVVSDCVDKNDTLSFADVALPATGWSEKDGTVTNSERRISRQRGIMPASGQAKHDWQIICDVAKAMGFEQGFDFNHPREIFDEYVGLTQADNNGKRDLDLSGLAGLSARAYDGLKPIQWPVNQSAPEGTKRLFTNDKFYTPSGKANFLKTVFTPPEQVTTNDYPFVLNSGRLRDQWHTMTRTGKASALTSHFSRPFLAMHPKDADAMALKEHDLVNLTAGHLSHEQSDICLPLVLDDKQRKGELFAPIHWSTTNSASSNITGLYTDANDKISGQPELKHAAVALTKVDYPLQGKIFVKQSLAVELLREKFAYFVTTPVEQGTLIYFGTEHSEAEVKLWLQINLPLYDEWVSVTGGDVASTFAMREGLLSLCLFMGKEHLDVDTGWISSLLAGGLVDGEQMHGLLNNQPDEQFKQGKLICSCFKVGENTIIDAIQKGCDSVDKLGNALKCGTNCGSCKSELSQLVNQHKGLLAANPNTDPAIEDMIIPVEEII
ncbi:nitrate reductase [Paraglaciecola aquimarina]|uniref:Nitrate reductase n=1 Tax=Paraglaciecola algarum TaxID=3050085 RepID=A0ABS9DAP3_9ALTE|nr:nitrate reductase [Paraglaciecola sp. G1-23]MCF2949994.1 nitrate reductase [Paraglaciecola sp. G1-23]